MGGCEKEESHVQAQVLDEQGDSHSTHTKDLFIMVHGLLDILPPQASVCLPHCTQLCEHNVRTIHGRNLQMLTQCPLSAFCKTWTNFGVIDFFM